MQYSFNLFNRMAEDGIALSLSRIVGDSPVVFLCIGSDLTIGDSLGPVTGTMLSERLGGECFVYGTLSKPVTAKEVRYIREFLKKTHPTSTVIVVDAAVGEEGDIGLIKVRDGALKPGSGAGKDLDAVGDVSIMGIIAEKSLFNYSLLNLTRLNIIYKMSSVIANALATFVDIRKERSA